MSKKKGIKIINSGTDPIFFNPNKYTKKIKEKHRVEGKLIITVSRLIKRKNIIDLIKAAKIVVDRYPKTKFLIIGKGEEKDNLLQLIKKLNLKNNIHLLGFIPEKDLPKYYATADIFTLTSKYEGQGTVNSEAMSSGTPVVSYDTTGARDIIINGKTGFITKHDYKEFANKLLILIKNEKLLKEMSKNARNHIVKNFTWDDYAKKHDVEFKKLIG